MLIKYRKELELMKAIDIYTGLGEPRDKIPPIYCLAKQTFWTPVL